MMAGVVMFLGLLFMFLSVIVMIVLDLPSTPRQVESEETRLSERELEALSARILRPGALEEMIAAAERRAMVEFYAPGGPIKAPAGKDLIRKALDDSVTDFLGYPVRKEESPHHWTRTGDTSWHYHR